MQNKTLKPSKTPLTDIEAISYTGQDPKRRMYRPGYEHFFEKMPLLQDNDEALESKIMISSAIMKQLSDQLLKDSWLKKLKPLRQEGFERTIIAIESPILENNVIKEGSEIVIARWGNGHSSPVHGHANGYLHEEILSGKMRINSYRMVDEKSNKVRIVKTEIVESGTFASVYTKQNTKQAFKRQALIHNFTSIGNSATLHYLPEHVRDGRDNKFEVEHFEDGYDLSGQVTRINAQQGMYLQIGDVVLVRSMNVTEYGDHFIIVTGPPVVKPHGMRVQDVAMITGPNTLLNEYKPEMGLTLLKLKEPARNAFLNFHNIRLTKNEVIIPNT